MEPLTPEELADPVHPYVRIHPDGTVVAYSNQIEMGQGAHTTLAMIVAEELDADFASVRVVNAANGVGPKGDVYGTPAGGGFIQLTGASTGTVGFWDRYRLAAAQARARLAAAAAEAWGVPAEEVEIESGVAAPPERAKRRLRRSRRPRRATAGPRRRQSEGPGPRTSSSAARARSGSTLPGRSSARPGSPSTSPCPGC